MIQERKPTITGAVPTVLNDVLRYAEKHPVDFSSLRFVLCGGSAVPRSLMESFQSRHGISIVQGWGMTETSPLAARAIAPKGVPREEEMDWRAKTGRIVPGVELRIVDDAGTVLPWDGAAVGEIQIRGPWMTASYYLDEDTQKFQDGWLRTGDVGTIDALRLHPDHRPRQGRHQVGRRVDLVGRSREPPDGPPRRDRGGGDRRAGLAVGRAAARLRRAARERGRPGRKSCAHSSTDRVARWWLPSKWAFIEQVPKTSVGKFDKKVLRARYGEEKLEVVDLDPSAAGSHAAS